jgi:hypothetical protein
MATFIVRKNMNFDGFVVEPTDIDEYRWSDAQYLVSHFDTREEAEAWADQQNNRAPDTNVYDFS